MSLELEKLMRTIMIMGRTILLMAGLAMIPFPVCAGFEFDKTKYSIHISNDISHPGSPSSEMKKEGAVRPESDPYAPSLQTYGERYVPDTIKNKYKISNDWYGKSEVAPAPQGESQGAEPIQLQPENSGTATAGKPSQGENSETRWTAAEGASLQDVLQTWSNNEGADLIWQAQGAYALKKPVNQAGYFEDAVFQILSQYDNDRTRPVGQLYTDPATGHKTLVVRTDTAS
jgi:hypothetical protein